jgi:hypothetical protein
MADRFPTFSRAGHALVSRAFWRPAARGAIGLASLVALGFLSNAFSEATCESAAHSYVIAFFRGAEVSKPLQWVPSSDLQDFYRSNAEPRPTFTLRDQARACFHPRLYFPRPGTLAPWAYVRPHIWDAPFLVRVHYGCLAKDLYGQAGVLTYLSFFGLRMPIDDWPHWMS